MNKSLTSKTITSQDLSEALSPLITGELHTDKLYRMLYSTDASNYQIEPLGVLFPKKTSDIQTAVKVCAELNISITSRGGGTSLSGQSIGEGLIIDCSKFMNQLLSWDKAAYTVQVEPGIALTTLNNRLMVHDQMIGPDPASAPVANIGGMVGNNSTGTHSIVYGMMADQVESLKMVGAKGDYIDFSEKSTEELSEIISKKTWEAEIYRGVLNILKKYRGAIKNHYPKIWRNVAGYNLNRLLETYEQAGKLNLASLIVGSEGTLGTITEVKVKTVQKPAFTQLALVHFEDLEQACEAVRALLETKPMAIEFSNDYFHELIDTNAAFRPIYRASVIGVPKALLIVEYAAEKEEDFEIQFEKLRIKLSEMAYKGKIVYRTTPEEVALVWQMRKAGFGLMMGQRGDAKPQSFADDATVPIAQLPSFIKEMEGIFAQENIRVAMVGHASAGCIHMNPNINLKTKEGLRQMKSMAIAIAETAIKYGGTTTGEHGEGIAKGYFNEKVYGPELHQAFREVKELFDPNYLFQPGKILDAPEPWNPDILRYNSTYTTPFVPKETLLDFDKDGGFGGMVEMCNGTGFCRKDEGGVMCPSYRATRDERHSTRGRSNALRAAIKGELLEGLYDKEVYETLDLCLECKACKVECPSIVDMAKLKYEYLYQYQQKHGVPIRNRLFAHIHRLSQSFQRFKGLYNFAIRQKALRWLMEKTIGIDRRRSIPPLSRESFQQWASRIPQINGKEKKGQVILWDDTYITFNQPELGKAAMVVLEAAGFEVLILKDRVCCGRPMISKGLLEEAKAHAEHNISLVLPYIRKGIPIIGIEPSCIASFKDEYPDLMRSEEAKEVASKSWFIEDFLGELYDKGALTYEFTKPQDRVHIKFHGHCYQKALGNTGSTLKLLRMIPGIEVEEISSGCCGMAGSFGYEAHHYEVSMACGEESLFPAIRSSDPSTVIAASGFSCRHQIADGVGGKAFHPIEILANFIT